MRQIYLQTVKKLGILRNRLILYHQLHPSIKWKANDDPAKKMGEFVVALFFKSLLLLLFLLRVVFFYHKCMKKNIVFFSSW